MSDLNKLSKKQLLALLSKQSAPSQTTKPRYEKAEFLGFDCWLSNRESGTLVFFDNINEGILRKEYKFSPAEYISKRRGLKK